MAASVSQHFDRDGHDQAELTKVEDFARNKGYRAARLVWPPSVSSPQYITLSIGSPSDF